MPRLSKCSACGALVKNLASHIASAHQDILIECQLNTEDIARRLHVSGDTVIRSIKEAGIRPRRRCPRCHQECGGMARHLLECHMPLLICARYTLNLEHKDVAAMFFDGKVSADTISLAYQAAKRRSAINIDNVRADQPSYAVPIAYDGGKFRVMAKGEIGRGFIYADPQISWGVLDV